MINKIYEMIEKIEDNLDEINIEIERANYYQVDYINFEERALIKINFNNNGKKGHWIVRSNQLFNKDNELTEIFIRNVVSDLKKFIDCDEVLLSNFNGMFISKDFLDLDVNDMIIDTVKAYEFYCKYNPTLKLSWEKESLSEFKNIFKYSISIFKNVELFNSTDMLFKMLR